MYDQLEQYSKLIAEIALELHRDHIDWPMKQCIERAAFGVLLAKGLNDTAREFAARPLSSWSALPLQADSGSLL
jgi:hypothetical protein